jgi:SIR2-like domain
VRFLADGPSIPDELLVARDEGRVVFFCGAGVSRARAGLPNFGDLAREVLLELEGSYPSPSKRLIKAAEEVEAKSGVSGLVSADRVFGFLERDFEIGDVQAAVAKALRPRAPVDLSAHKIMLDLARGPDGRTRLVTTNFDLLFEDCDGALQSRRPPRLPDPERYDELDCIVHLHGQVTKDYSTAEGDGFVLSSATFGEAYISRGWATRFISSILKRYLVVFVGYTADDPPVQYLLEALNRQPGSNTGLYAFQAGSHSEAEARWLHKGVQPIPYDDRDHHKALWDALEAWAERARDVDGWYAATIAMAHRGPAALAPHERGQVKHVVSTLEGARKFSDGDRPPPAEWLCVFDAGTRFAPPGRVYATTGRTLIDPFESYGLDSDSAPTPVRPDDFTITRTKPTGAWHCFELTRLDREGLAPNYFASLSGNAAGAQRPLAPRLATLGTWLSKVSGQPAAVWWASTQKGLHANVESQIRHHLERDGSTSSSEIRTAWRYVFEASEYPDIVTRRDWFDLRASIILDGWSAQAIRQLAALHRPYISIGKPLVGGPKPPDFIDGLQSHHVVSVDVKYPPVDVDVPIPDEHLLAAVRAWRGVVEHAVLLERDVGRYALDHLASFTQEVRDNARPLHGLQIPVMYYLDLLRRLMASNAEAARQECASWWADDETVFARLRIWACGEERLFDVATAGKELSELSQRVFWALGHQADLMSVLARRWAAFPPGVERNLAERLLAGPDRFGDEDDGTYRERRAWTILKRIHWLSSQGCRLSFDLDAETAKLTPLVPDWVPESAREISESEGSGFRETTTNSEFSELLSVPLAEVLARAQEISKRDEKRGVNREPFAGLASKRPVRALSALRLGQEAGVETAEAWRTFLRSEARRSDRLRLLAIIAERLAELPQPLIVELVHPIADWMMSVSQNHPIKVQQFDSLWPKVLGALRTSAGSAGTRSSGKDVDWASEALNSAAGKLAQVLMSDSRKADPVVAAGFADGWLPRVEELLAIGGDVRRQAIAIFSFNLIWFFHKDPAWTEAHLLCVLGHPDYEDALWAGFLWNGHIAQRQLYLRLKAALLGLVRRTWMSQHGHQEILAAVLLAGWDQLDTADGTRTITDDEMRGLLLDASDEFRAQVLWHLGGCINHAPDTWTANARTFLTAAWPRQKVIKTPRTSARLCELALSSPRTFAQISDLVISRARRAEGEHLGLLGFVEKSNEFLALDAERVLALLHAVLPTDVREWPYKIETVFDKIGNANPALVRDARLIELWQRWNSR